MCSCPQISNAFVQSERTVVKKGKMWKELHRHEVFIETIMQKKSPYMQIIQGDMRYSNAVNIMGRIMFHIHRQFLFLHRKQLLFPMLHCSWDYCHSTDLL